MRRKKTGSWVLASTLLLLTTPAVAASHHERREMFAAARDAAMAEADGNADGALSREEFTVFTAGLESRLKDARFDIIDTDSDGLLRVRARITSHFRIPSSRHLRPLLNREFLDVAQTTPVDSLNRRDRIWRKSGREFWEVILGSEPLARRSSARARKVPECTGAGTTAGAPAGSGGAY